MFSKTNQPTFEAKSQGQLRRNYRNEVLRRVMSNKIGNFCTKEEIKKLKKLCPDVSNIVDKTVEDVMVYNLSRFCTVNAENICSNNAISMIKALCTSNIENFAQALELKLTKDEANI